jgi:SulP family sulfate permease
MVAGHRRHRPLPPEAGPANREPAGRLIEGGHATRLTGPGDSPQTGTGLRPRPGDLVAGVSAAFVLIPQALAYASLAGLPAERGLYVAALAPLAAALVASSPYLGTGPTALTSLLTFGAVAAVARPESAEYIALASLLALMVGVIRVVLGLAKAGFVAYLMSQPLITGFTTGAALVIIASQIPTILGFPSGSDRPLLATYEALTRPAAWNPEALGLAAGVVIVMLFGQRLHRLFPSVLVVVVVAVAYSEASGYDGSTLGTVSETLPSLSVNLPWSDIPQLIVPSLVIAVVGFAEPAAIARQLATLERSRWDPNRELIGQGLANLAAGLGGGFPAGGSFSRSALLRDLGARTRVAGAVTGLVVLALTPFLSLLSALPTAVLGAIVVMLVADLIEIRILADYRRFAPLQFSVAIATLALTVALAPHVERAVMIGVALAVGAHLWRELRLSIPAWTSDGELHLAPKGVLYFASAPGVEDAFLRLLHEHRDARRLIVHLDGLGRVDLTGALVLRGLLRAAREAGLEAEVVDVPPQARTIISRVIEK